MQEAERPVRIAVVSGSIRPNNYTNMAAAIAIDELKKQPEVSVDFVNPAELRLPFPGQDLKPSDTKALQQIVASATGVVLVTPEYHGSFSSVMKLVIENLGFPSVLAGKPVALLGVAAGSIGAIKSLEQLRSVASHVGAIVLPLPTSIANVQKVFDAQGKVLDPLAEKMLRRVALNLVDYIRRNLCPAVTLERVLRQNAAADPNIVTV
ncbi:MAG TPA: NAD(P)H-dependent oxidoreductase [Bryobacteraceae bacterium]|nr:NAD(P)H-dependent oxidoreductase [Bryobacteraceae bacterium]